MGNGYPVIQPDELADMKALIQSAFTKIRELERPTGTQLSDAVATLQALVAGLLNQTNVTATGTVTAGGRVTSTGDTFWSAYARAHSVTSGYAAAYINGDGSFLSTISSARFKRDVERKTWSRKDRQKIRVVTYRLRSAYILADMRGEDPASVEFQAGVIAEELLAAGFPEFVIFDKKGRVSSVHYELLALIALDGLQQVEVEVDAMRAEIAILSARLDSAGL